MKKKFSELAARVVLKAAINSERKTSLWGCYQPQMPKKLIDEVKKKDIILGKLFVT